MGLEKLLPLVFDALLTAAGALKATTGFGSLAGQLLADGSSKLLGVALWHPKPAVEGGNACLDLLDPHSSTLAVVGLGFTPHTDEVLIRAAVAGVAGVDLAATTLGAVDGGA
ncbi:hypothetical protein [Amycolatopsis samaneae]|uniref:Uncharacterized protein n=1 Tax=Amycolatopsis samaneae TaxID=664691 RepID=A0ABW5GUV5_9PSEU